MKLKLRRRCVNEYRSYEIHEVDQVVDFMWYRREDLWEWSKEAFINNKPFFYCRPVDPDKPFGKLELCEPEYVYEFSKKIFSESDLFELPSMFDSQSISELIDESNKEDIMLRNLNLNDYIRIITGKNDYTFKQYNEDNGGSNGN